MYPNQWDNYWAPVEFVHGTNYSSLLSFLINGAKLKKSERTKKEFQGAWVAQQNGFDTCSWYAGPELAWRDEVGSILVQAFVVGRTIDLRTPKGDKWYRVITTPEGHECTHVVLRVWNDSEGRRHDHVQMTAKGFQKSLSGYHFRPPGGLSDTASFSFAESFASSLADACV